MYDIYTPPPEEMTVFIFDRDLNFLGVLENFSSFIIERSLFGAGSFSMSVALGEAGTEHLRNGNIVSLGKSDSRAGIIGVRQIENGQTRTITVSGHTLKGVASKRIIVPPTETEVPGSYGWESIDTTEAENVLRHYFNLCCVNPRDANRTIPGVVMDDLHDPPRGPVTPWNATIKETLVSVLQGIGDWTEYGWDVRLDITNRRLVFVVVPLRDRTLGTTGVVLFSREVDNLGPYSYTENTRDFSGALYIGGAGQDEEHFVLTEYVNRAGRPLGYILKGWDRDESYIAAGNISDPEKLIYEGLHRYTGRMKPVETASGDVYNIHPFRYGYEWDLGDKVTVLLYDQGLETRVDQQVTTVLETYEGGYMQITPTFGKQDITQEERIEQLERSEGT